MKSLTIIFVILSILLIWSSSSAQVDNKLEFAKGELVITFKGGFSSSQISQTLSEYNLEIIRAYTIVPNTYLVREKGLIERTVAQEDDQNVVQSLVSSLEAEQGILNSEPNYKVHAIMQPNDPGLDGLYAMNNTGQTGGTVDADIDALKAWDLTTGDTTVIVGIIDTGIDYDHPDLAANMWKNPGEIPNNNIDDDGNGYVDDVYGYDFAYNDGDPSDYCGHGTHCAGTVSAVGNNGEGVAGVAWKVKLMAIKFLDDNGYGYTSDAISALEYATTMGATLTSNSWGGGSYSSALETEIANSNMLFIAAAGNEGGNTDLYPHYPSSYDLDNIIAVAATDHNDDKAYFSNYGAVSVDLGAPGVDILSTKPDNPTDIPFRPPGWGLSPTYYGIISGTSMATPHVAGTAALLYSRNPALSWSEAKAAILDNVDPVSSMNGITVSGGRLNAYNAVWSVQSGIIFSSDSLNFGIKGIGETAKLTIDITNATDSVVTINFTSDNNVFSPANSAIAIYNGRRESIDVLFAPISRETYRGTLTCDAGDTVIYVDMVGTGDYLPIIGLSSGTLTFELAGNDSSEQAVTISNRGLADLTWYVSGILGMNSNLRQYPASYYEPIPKGAVDTRVGNPVISNSGGPDSYGYNWIDSDQKDGLKFEWLDISSSGTQVTGLGDDDFTGPFPIGFTFNYYGNDYKEFYIAANGFIGFGPTANYDTQNNDPVPRENAPNNLLAWCWDDLEPKAGLVYYQYLDSKLIVQFVDYGEFGADGTVNAEVILHENGAITYQYLNFQNGFDVLHCTVGIENSDGSDGLEVVFNNSYLHDSLAVQFSTNQWLAVTPQNGTITPGGSQQIVVTANSSGLTPGTYQSYLAIYNNDTDKNPANIPITMTVDAQKITFSVNMSIYESIGYFNPEMGDYITVPGIFNEWATDPSYQLTDIGSSIYEGTFPMYGEIGDTLEFKYFIHAGDGRSLPNSGWEDSVDVYGGSDGNRGFVLNGGDQRLPTVYFNNNDIGFPEISVAPDSFDVTLVEGDSVTNLFKLNNIGKDSLSYRISIRNLGTAKKLFLLNLPGSERTNPDSGMMGSPQPEKMRTQPLEAELDDLTGVQILWDVYHGQNNYYYWSTIINDVTNRGAVVVENYDPITLDLLNDYDILWLTDMIAYFQQTEIQALQQWINAGGSLILEGDDTFAVYIFNEILSALAAGIEYSDVNGSYGLTTNIFPHQTTQDVSEIFIENNLAHLSEVSSPGAILINDVMGVTNTAYSLIGYGKIMAMADELSCDYSIIYGDNQLFANQVIDWLVRDVSSFWLSAYPDSGEVAPGDSQHVNIDINASKLPAKTHLANLIIESNDPIYPSIEKPVKLTVLMLNPPDIEVSPDSFFVELNEGDSTKKLIKIENQGTGDLNWEISLTSLSSMKRIYKLNNPSNTEGPPENTVNVPVAGTKRKGDLIAELEDLSSIKILWDYSHGQSGTYYWSTIIDDLKSRGATVVENWNPITPELLNEYDIFWSTDLNQDFSAAEMNAINEWVTSGGALLLEGDNTYSIYTFNNLLSLLEAGIAYDGTDGQSGITSNIYPHEMTVDVNQIYLSGNYAHLSSVTKPAQVLIEDVSYVANTAYSQVGHGRILVIADEVFSNSHISFVDNQLFANQAFDWLAKGRTGWLTFVPKFGSITPNDYHEVKLKINALDLSFGTYQANLTIKSNDPDNKVIGVPIKLTVYMPNPPKITVSPDSFNIELSEGDTTAQKLIIGNEGVGDLNWSMEIEKNRNMQNSKNLSQSEDRLDNNDSDSNTKNFTPLFAQHSLDHKTQILAWTKYADMYEEYQNTLRAISQYYYNYTVTTTTVTDSGALRTELADKDILLIPEQEGGDKALFSSLGNSWKTVLDEFVHKGGTVILCGSSNGSEQILKSSGLMNLDYYTYYYYGTMTVLDTTHFITKGLPSIIDIQDYTMVYNITDWKAKKLVTTGIYATVAAKDIGSGHVVLVGYDFYQYDDNAAKIISSAVKWSSIVSWISLSQHEGTVAPQDTQEISLTLDASYLTAGFYSANLVLHANDPESQVNAVPVNLTVRMPDPPEIVVSPDSFAVKLAEGDSTTDKLKISNIGLGKLKWSIKVKEKRNNPASLHSLHRNNTELYIQHKHLSRFEHRSDKNNKGEAKIGPIPMAAINSLTGSTKILAWTTYADMNTEYPNTLNAISQYYTDYSVTTTIVTDSSALRMELTDKDVFLIPEQEGGSSYTFSNLGSSWKEVLHDFVSNGGTVILCGSSYGSENILSSSDLMSLTYWSRYSYGTMDVLDTTHFVTNGLPSSIPVQPYTMVYNISDQQAKTLARYQSYPTVAAKEIGNGHVILVGYDFYQYDDNAAQIISNAVKGQQLNWLVIAPLTGIVAPSDSQTVVLKITATELAFGKYEAAIYLNSNDSDEGNIEIPVKLTVYDPDPPKLTVTPNSFNVEITEGDTSTQRLVIGNEGIGDLNWSIDISENNNTPQVQNNTFPNRTAYYNHNKNLEKRKDFSDDDNEGKAEIGPIPMKVMSSLQGNTKILAWTKYADMYSEYPNTLNAISQYYIDYTVTTTSVVDSAALRTALVDKDIFLIPKQEGGSNNTFASLGNRWKNVLNQFVNNDGTIILCGSTYGSEQILKSGGLMDVNYYTNYSYGTMTVLDTTHFVTKGLATSIPFQRYTMVYHIYDTQADVLVKIGNYPSVAAKTIGCGNVILIGCDYYQYDENTAKLISNAVKWSSVISWIACATDSGTVAPQGSQEVMLKLDASALTAGKYSAAIEITSNDPDSLLINVPFNLTILAAPDPKIKVSPDSFYVELSRGDSTSRTLSIMNSGSGELTYELATGAALNNMMIGANPGENTQHNRKPEQKLGDENEINFKAHHETAAKIRWLFVSPENGTVAVDSTTMINVFIDARYLAEGTYNCDIIIKHNDTDTSAIKIPVVLRIAPVMADVADENSRELPRVFGLSQNYPNPFNPVTNIMYQLPEPGYVTLRIYDILGREVIALVDKNQGAGYYNVQWNGTDKNGMPVSSGVYFYVIRAEKFTKSKKMILMQ